MPNRPRWEQIRRLPINHVFTTSAAGEIHSAQCLALPTTWLPNEFRLSALSLQALGPFYFRRLSVLSGRLIRVREGADEISFEVALLRLRLLCFAPAQITKNTACYPIIGGFMLAPGAPQQGLLCLSLVSHNDELRIGMEVRHYYSRISGTGGRLRRWLYEQTQARLHHLIANDFVRQVALALVSGTFGA